MSDDTQQRLLEAAGRVFADRGYRDATVREICAEADVNLAAVNYYFGDKRRLYIEAVKCAHRSMIEQVPMPEWPPETPPQERLQQFVRTLLNRMLGEKNVGWRPRLMLREVIEPTEACRELVDQYFRPHFEILLGILRQIVPADTPPQVLHQLGFSVVGQCLFYRVAGEIAGMMIGPREHAAYYSREQLADHISRVSLAALGCVAPFGSVSFARGPADPLSTSSVGDPAEQN
ncbi:MAG: CerR family C-terminal domain-containing protein [Pirellulales bacterium]|nr:CerR family C-terminal domain-containing protein [Planctomycetales bacterium]